MYTSNKLSSFISMQGRGTHYTSKTDPNYISIASLYTGGTDTKEHSREVKEGFSILGKRLVKNLGFLSAALRNQTNDKITSRGYPITGDDMLKAFFLEGEKAKKKHDWMDLPKTERELATLVRFCNQECEYEPIICLSRTSYKSDQGGKEVILAKYEPNERCYYLDTPRMSNYKLATFFVPFDKLALFYLNKNKFISVQVKKKVAIATMDLFSRFNPHFMDKKVVRNPITVNISLPYGHRSLTIGKRLCEEYYQGFMKMSELLADEFTMTIQRPINSSLTITLS